MQVFCCKVLTSHINQKSKIMFNSDNYVQMQRLLLCFFPRRFWLSPLVNVIWLYGQLMLFDCMIPCHNVFVKAILAFGFQLYDLGFLWMHFISWLLMKRKTNGTHLTPTIPDEIHDPPPLPIGHRIFNSPPPSTSSKKFPTPTPEYNPAPIPPPQLVINN